MKRLPLVGVMVFLAAVLWGGVAGAAATVTDLVRAEEISTGEVVGGTRFGNTFRGPATGTLPGEFTAALDYSPPTRGGGVTNRITGGTWSLLAAQGEVFGQFTGGSIQWSADGRFAVIRAPMAVNGGSGAFANARGSGTLSGVILNTGGPLRLVAAVQVAIA